MPGLVFAVPAVLILIVLLGKCIRVVPQASAWVVEFLGSYHVTLGNGLHFTIPIVQRVVRKVSLKEQVEDFPPQPVITKDNVTMKIDAVVYFSIFDPKLFTYGVENPIMALENLTATTLRNIVGEMELDETLTSRDTINNKMQAILDPATDRWGIRVNRVELKNIMPPADIQNAMEKQMKAERDRRQAVLESEAHAEAATKRAKGDSEALITKARGEAEALRLVAQAKADSMKLLSSVSMSDSALTLKRLEAFEKVADGRSTKLIIPTELSGVVSSLSVIGDALGLNMRDPYVQDIPAIQDDCCDKPDKSQVTRQQVQQPAREQQAQQAFQQARDQQAQQPERRQDQPSRALYEQALNTQAPQRHYPDQGSVSTQHPQRGVNQRPKQ